MEAEALRCERSRSPRGTKEEGRWVSIYHHKRAGIRLWGYGLKHLNQLRRMKACSVIFLNA